MSENVEALLERAHAKARELDDAIGRLQELLAAHPASGGRGACHPASHWMVGDWVQPHGRGPWYRIYKRPGYSVIGKPGEYVYVDIELPGARKFEQRHVHRDDRWPHMTAAEWEADTQRSIAEAEGDYRQELEAMARAKGTDTNGTPK